MKHFTRSVFAAPLLACCCVSHAVLEVARLTVEPMDDDGVVSVVYDIENTDGGQIFVSLEYTTNGEFWAEAIYVSGDVGESVTQGYYREIIWDARRELPDELFPAMRVRVRAEDGFEEEVPPIPEGFAYLPTATFTMGSGMDERASIESIDEELVDPSDEILHQVRVTHSIFASESEVSFAEWTEVRAWGLENGYTDLPEGQSGADESNPATHPVTMISWFDAVKWLNAKSERERLSPCYRVDGDVFRIGQRQPSCDFKADGFRLPTESEWEYASRAGAPGAFYTGSIQNPGESPLDASLDRAGWYAGNSDGNTAPVGSASKEPNGFDLREMHGNAAEWCWDWYGPYRLPAMIDPTGARFGEFRIVRGGAYSDTAAACRSAFRGRRHPEEKSPSIGFRIVQTYGE